MKSKAQINVVSVLLITLIVLVLTSIGYFWGAPLIDKAVAFQKKEQIESDMIRLYDLAIKVANDKSKGAEVIDVVAGRIQLRDFYNESDTNLFNNSKESYAIGPLSPIFLGDAEPDPDGDDFAGIRLPRHGVYSLVKFNISTISSF